MSLGQFIKEKRIENNLSLEQLGKKVGVSKMTISRWESGEIKNMGSDKIEKLALALGVPVLSLFKGFDENANKIEHEQLTRNDFAIEVLNLMTKLDDLTEQEKALLEHTINLISSYKK